MESMACSSSSSVSSLSAPALILSQRFGSEINALVLSEADIITALEYDLQGRYMATGDKGGRIVVFDRVENDSVFTRCEREGEEAKDESKHSTDAADRRTGLGDWKPYCQFKSHDAQFDYLKSLEIEEKINQIKFLPQIGNNKLLLATNDKTIKLWRVGERLVIENDMNYEGNENVNSYDELVLPNISGRREILATPKRVYENGHAYHINSVSLNSDRETFLSADDLRINWWHHERVDTCFNLVDIKPPVMEDLTRVITTAQFHPQHCHILMYGSSTGSLQVVDTREAAICDHSARHFDNSNNSVVRYFFSEITSSISDANFSPDGRYMAVRDYMTIKIWDLHMEREPVLSILVDARLGECLSELYESDNIFDKFEVRYSADGKKVITGGYNNEFMIWDAMEGKMLSCIDLVQADKAFDDDQGIVNSSPLKPRTPLVGTDKKILHCAFHPRDDALGVAGQAGLFFFETISDQKIRTF